MLANRRIRMVGQAAVVALIMLVPSVIMPRDATAFFNGGCTAGTSGNFHEYKGLNSSRDLGGVLLKGSSGDIDTHQQLFPCTTPGHGFSVVLAANLQQGNNGSGIVQIGIGRQNDPSYGWPASTDPVFVWTSDDHGPGVLTKLTWFANGTQPIYGHLYGFSVYMSSWWSDSTKPAWTFCIYDNTAASNWCDQIHRHWNNSTWGEPVSHGSSYGDYAWSGYETGNTMDAIGRPANLTPVKTYRINGQRRDNNTWVTKAPIAACDHDASGDPSAYTCSVSTTQVSRDTIYAQTSNRP